MTLEFNSINYLSIWQKLHIVTVLLGLLSWNELLVLYETIH